MTSCVATKSAPRDPLDHLLARGRISQAQFRAAQEFRKHFALAKQGPLGPNGERGGTDGNAGKWLTKAYRELGQDGSALVHDMLIGGRTTRQIAEARGKAGPQWPRYYARKLGECLHALARVYGLSGEEKKPRAGTTLPMPSPPSP